MLDQIIMSIARPKPRTITSSLAGILGNRKTAYKRANTEARASRAMKGSEM